MSEKAKLAPVLRISQLMFDAQLAELDRAAAARAQSLARLADLERAPNSMDLPFAAAERARILYGIWAEARRREINLVLARQTAEWLDARDRARRALGRLDALSKLETRLTSGRK
jgi:hypothetical protein